MGRKRGEFESLPDEPKIFFEDTKSLRLGNYVKTEDDVICQVIGLNLVYIEASPIGSGNVKKMEYDQWQPVPVCIDWFEHLNFELQNDDVWLKHINKEFSFEIDLEGNVCIYSYQLGDQICLLRECKYLHDFQNSFFAVTNEELFLS